MRKVLNFFSRTASIGLFSAFLRLHKTVWSLSLLGTLDTNAFVLWGNHQHKYRRFSRHPLSLTVTTAVASISSPTSEMVTLSLSSSIGDQNKPTDQYFVSSSNSDALAKLMLEVVSSCDNFDKSTPLSGKTLNDACRVLHQFISQQSKTNATINEDINLNGIANESAGESDAIDAKHLRSRLSSYSLIAAERLCRIAHDQDTGHDKKGRKNRKRTWEALQNAAGILQNTPFEGETSIPLESSAMAVSMVFGALSLLQQQQSQYNLDENGSAKAAASALSSTVSRNSLLRQAGQPLSSLVLRSCVDRAFCDKQELFRFDLNILNHLAKSFRLTDKSVEPRAIAHVVRKAVPELQTTSEREDLVKQTTAGAFALSCQLRPWSVLSPIELIDAATAFDFYHAAEEICRSAHKAAKDQEASPMQSSEGNNGNVHRIGFSALQQQENVRSAVEKLVDTAMDARMYRRADALATSLYSMGGKSRYVEARYLHACDTIAKVVSRRQFPIVDRQIERVAKAVAKVKQCKEESKRTSDDSTTVMTQSSSSATLPITPELEIRKYAIEKCEEVGEFAAALRLASLHGMEYVYDEEAILQAAKLRREKYLQYDDVLSGEIPLLITETHELLSSFDRLVNTEEEAVSSSPSANKHRGKHIGFDAEWDEETQGVALLQLATTKTVLLVDVPALSSTEDGVAALKGTVGKILDNPEWTVIGFSCRQDLSRLRATPCVQIWQQQGDQPQDPQDTNQQQQHWLSGASSVVDVQTLVWNAEPTLRTTGLSRACEHFLGKPLDKSEQCSMWSGRPLSDRQRSYAALDAWVCVGIYKKLLESETTE
mmetsp:Transcript_26830/g.73799  ORF Transcript_26830/g.73799 Transcript_26830/m.73799 type:complete len:827 (+) Transcript_26830:97-2577(+)